MKNQKQLVTLTNYKTILGEDVTTYWEQIKYKLRLSEDFIRAFQDIVDWDTLGWSQDFSEDFLLEFQDKFGWNRISGNQILSEDFIRKYQDKVDWFDIGWHQKLSEQFIEEFQDKLGWRNISSYQKISENFIRKYQDKVSWSSIPRHQRLSEKFIAEFANRVSWYAIAKKQKLSEEFIKKCQHRLDWSYISRYQILSESFIREFQDKLDWDFISKYQKLTKQFMKEFQDKINWEIISKDKKVSKEFIQKFYTPSSSNKKKEKTQFPARVHILTAKNSKQAIVIRRGPSKQTCILGWNLEDDTFEVTQWLSGKIEERLSDISPSGKYWIYYARKGGKTFTAIAKTPWLKALTFYENSYWSGGGGFLDDTTYWVYGLGDPMYSSPEVKRDASYSKDGYMYDNRLQRNGWKLNKEVEKESLENTIFDKELSHKWTLRKICRIESDAPEGKRGGIWDEHMLINQRGEKLKYPDWEWAEWLDNMIYYVQKGILYKVSIQNENQLSDELLIHDFNPYKFQRKKAPY